MIILVDKKAFDKVQYNLRRKIKLSAEQENKQTPHQSYKGCI